MSEPLKPCPFCGWRAYLLDRADGGNWPHYGACGNCGTCGPREATEEDAVEAWNHRASPWRPWSELDPEEHGEVLARFDDGDVEVLRHIADDWWLAGFAVGGVLGEPTHFIPIPPLDPPREETRG